MRKEYTKIRFRVTDRQKISMKTIRKLVFFSAAFAILLLILFNFSDYRKAKASNHNDIEFRELHDQVFSNEMALPAPIAGNLHFAGQNTIFIQKVKSPSPAGNK